MAEINFTPVEDEVPVQEDPKKKQAKTINFTPLEEPVKKKDEPAPSQGGVVSFTPLEEPTKPSVKSTPFKQTRLSEPEEKQYQKWRKSLPANLQSESEDYDLRGAFKAGLTPEKSEDGSYHLSSRDPKTGLLLKSPKHPTYNKLVEGEKNAGYAIFEKDGREYSQDVSGLSDAFKKGQLNPEDRRQQFDSDREEIAAIKNFATGHVPQDNIFLYPEKTLKAVAGDLIPQAFLTASAAGTRLEPYKEGNIKPEDLRDAANFLFRKKISEGKYLEALSVGEEEAMAYIQEQIKQPEEFQRQQIKEKVSLLQQADQQRREFEKETKGLITTINDIKTPSDVVGYIAYNVGQSLPQIATSLITGGMSSYVQEYSEIYDQQLQKIATDKGMSIEEVVKQGLDDPLAGEYAAALAASLDRVGVEAIFKNFGKNALKNAIRSGSRVQIAKNIGINGLKTGSAEGLTEGGQYIVEETGSSLAAGRDVQQSIQDIDAQKFIESVAAGTSSGGIIGAGGTAINSRMPVDKTVEQIAKTVTEGDVVSAEQAAQQIEEVVQSQSPDSKNQDLVTFKYASKEEVPDVFKDRISSEGEINGRSFVKVTIPKEEADKLLTQDVQRQTDDGGLQQTVEVADDTKTPTAQEEESKQAQGGSVVESELETLRQQIRNSPEDVKIDGRKVTMITEKGADMVRRFVELKEQLDNTKNETPSDAQTSTEPGGTVVEQPVSAELVATEAQSVGREEGKQQAPNVAGNTATQEAKPGGIPPTTKQADTKSEPAGDARTLKIAKRIMDSDANEAIKKGVKEKGATYVPKKIEVTDKEAQDLVDLYGDERSESIVRDTKNDVTPDTRMAMSAKLYESYKKQGDAATDPIQKQAFYDKAVDVGLFTAEYAKELGRGVNAAKIMKAITSDEDLAVIALEKANKGVARKLVAPIQKQVSKTKEQIDNEIRRLVEQKVQETVETRLARAKLITADKKKKISDAFDALKVKDVKGAANDITRVLGAAVWNGSVEAVKRAVLTGADLANAIQAGIDYIRDNHKGDFSEDEFRNLVSPAIAPLIEQQKIKASDIDESKVKTKGLSAKKKKDLITQVVEEYNQKGEISDERFDELYAKQIGYREYTPNERAQIRELAKVIGEAEKFSQDLQENFSREKISQYKDLMKKAQKANQNLQAFVREPSSLTDTLITIMQGNLLTPLSIVTNIYSNAALQPLRFTASAVGSIVERGVNMAAKVGLLEKAYRDPTIDLIAVQKGFAQGAWNGTMEGLYQLKEGTLAQDKNLREIQSSFNPARAIARWSEADRNTKQKINDWVEGTLGWPAEGMFRLLNFGDKPFRRAAEIGRAMEIIERKKLKGDDALKFLMFPDEQSAAEIDKAGKEATFQQDGNIVTKYIQDKIIEFLNTVEKIPYVGGVAKFILKTQIPFVKTPLNIVGETLDYALPPLTIARGIWEVRDGNSRAGYVRIGKGLVGLMIMAAARQLFELGILSWEDDDDKKGRNIQYESVPPASMNVSALTRGLLGEGFETQDGDAWVNYKKLGIVGILFDTYTRSYKSGVEEDGQMPGFAQEMAMGPVTVGSSVLEQSFLQGTNSLLNALQDGGGYKTQQWAVNTVGTMTSVVIPNTIATISKSSDEFIRETYSRDIVDRLRATYMTKLFAGEQLPPKINIWGEKVTGNPEGRDKYVYYLFDPTKFKEVDTESYQYKLYDAWKNDKFNNDWLPSLPKRSVSVKGVDMKLTPEEYSEFCTAVGEFRANATSAYVNSSWRYHTSEARIKKLKDIYSDGMAYGKKKFLMNQGWNVKTKEALEEINKTR